MLDVRPGRVATSMASLVAGRRGGGPAGSLAWASSGPTFATTSTAGVDRGVCAATPTHAASGMSCRRSPYDAGTRGDDVLPSELHDPQPPPAHNIHANTATSIATFTRTGHPSRPVEGCKRGPDCWRLQGRSGRFGAQRPDEVCNFDDAAMAARELTAALARQFPGPAPHSQSTSGHRSLHCNLSPDIATFSWTGQHRARHPNIPRSKPRRSHLLHPPTKGRLADQPLWSAGRPDRGG